MSAATQRDLAIQIARTDPSMGLKRARRVSDPWHRAQALAWVAQFAPADEVVKLAEEAVRAAGAGKDTYQQVAACAWAVRALAERRHIEQAAELVRQSVGQSADISHPVSRLNALFLLWQAAWPLDVAERRHALDRLVAASEAASSWHVGRIMHDAALMVAAQDEVEAQRLIDRIPEGRYRRQAQKRLDQGQTLEPRAFFW